MLRIGIDVGGTNTDAVVMRERTLLAAAKVTTTPDVRSGIVAALQEVLRQSQVSPLALRAVMLGTTQFTNALVERKGLGSVGLVRIARPAAMDVPPQTDWPDDLRRAFDCTVVELCGGYDFDGTAYAALQPDTSGAFERLLAAGVSGLAVSQVFAPIRNDMERAVAEALGHAVPGVPCTISSAIGGLGFLERENATILNAALCELANSVVDAYEGALHDLGIEAPLYISQNDGTLMSAARARTLPILTMASGPTNSLRGAAFLTGLSQAIVADVGGTTTDVGVIVHGFPRQSSLHVDVGGVRTNFRMPDVLSIGLGGGSVVHAANPQDMRVGPRSVGHQIKALARIFGGETLTATDIAVAAGQLQLGDRAAVAGLDPALVSAAMRVIGERFADAVERMRTSAAPIPIVLVGGGASLIPQPSDAACEIVRPAHAEVANAIGAAIAQVGAELDQIVSLATTSRAEAIADFERRARAAAVAAGAAASDVEIIDVEATPLPYLPGRMVRLRVRAAGSLTL